MHSFPKLTFTFKLDKENSHFCQSMKMKFGQESPPPIVALMR